MIFPKSDIRSQVLSILSEESPLSFRKVNNKLRKEYGRAISDKALYRIIGLMVNDGFLIKNGNEHLISDKWLENLDKFKAKTVKTNIEGSSTLKNRMKFYALSKQECACGKGHAEGFCYVCNEPVCKECGDKERMHISCFDKCDKCKFEYAGKCTNCLKDACFHCSKVVWSHYSEFCIKKPDKIVLGILEVDHECWFADLSEKIDKPIVLQSFIDEKDPEMGTHSGRIAIDSVYKAKAINHLLKHKQIVEVKPLYSGKQMVLRTRALINKSVDEFVRKNKSILLNPIEANDTKERNLVISPSLKEMHNLVKGLNEYGSCKIIAFEEIDMHKITSPSSREIRSFVKIVDEDDLDSAVQKIRLMKRFPA